MGMILVAVLFAALLGYMWWDDRRRWGPDGIGCPCPRCRAVDTREVWR